MSGPVPFSHVPPLHSHILLLTQDALWAGFCAKRGKGNTASTAREGGLDGQGEGAGGKDSCTTAASCDCIQTCYV